VISHYYYHLHTVKDPLHHLAKSNSFSDWLDLSIDANNLQTQYICGGEENFKPTEEDFEIAKQHLIEIPFVGLTERFEDSVLLLKYYLGFNVTYYTTHKIGRRPRNLSPELIQKIKDYNQFDIQLYEIAKKKFKHQIQRIEEEFQTKFNM